MSLVAGHGPLSLEPAGWFTPSVPDAPVYVEPHPRRIVALVGDRPVIVTERALMVHRRGQALSYAFPADEAAGLPHAPVAEALSVVHRLRYSLRRTLPKLAMFP